MQAGKLRQRVEIQTLTTTQDGYGEMVESWATLATVWGEMRPSLRATREAFGASVEQRSARTTYECKLRYKAGLDPYRTRLVWDGRTFDVESVMDPDGRTRELVLLCYVRE